MNKLHITGLVVSLSVSVSEVEDITVYFCYWGAPFFDNVTLIDFYYLVFTRVSGDSHRIRFRVHILNRDGMCEAQVGFFARPTNTTKKDFLKSALVS